MNGNIGNAFGNSSPIVRTVVFINWEERKKEISVSLDELGLGNDIKYHLLNFWTGEKMKCADKIQINVPAKDVTLFAITQ